MDKRNETKSQPSRYTIRAVSKALDLLQALADANAGHSLAELSRELGLPKSSVFRHLVTLEDAGYIERVPGNEAYRLGLKLFELGSLVAAQFDVRHEAIPFMRHLLATFQETVNLAIMEGGEVVYLEILESTRSIRMSAQPGQRHSPHSTALGKAMLAYLSEVEVEAILASHGLPALTSRTITTVEIFKAELAGVRERGYAVDDMENEAGARCVGAPIFNHRGEAVAAISVSGPADRMRPPQIDAVGKELVRATRAISKRLGYRGQA